jgi:glycosyltransferase involved in cell wall biosynthesis
MEATAHAQAARLESVRAQIDSVYFLMFDGWAQELESNRWHYARRWARHLPVTLLQPSQRVPRSQDAAAAPGIDNCEVLPVLQPRGEMTYLPGLVQAAQVMEHMARRGHSKSLLWSYNPWLAALYAAVPAVARVYHASENHFDIEGMPDLFYRQLEATLRVSDLVIPISSGVADGTRARFPQAKLAVVTNGCDTSCYGPWGSGSAAIEAMRDGFERVAVFAGNINGRLDFELVEQVARSNTRTLVVLAGPVARLSESEAESWQRALGVANVRHVGRMEPAELAALYRSADLGFIPYRREDWIVRNGFPLKTLEMAATGLPVVATHMQPIVGIASAIVVAEDDPQFLDRFATLSRSSLADEERRELLQVAAANDYDRKFEQVIGYVAAVIPTGREAHTRLDDLMPDLGVESWSASCTRIFDRFRASPVLVLTDVYDRLSQSTPGWIHRLVPASLKNRVRSLRVE